MSEGKLTGNPVKMTENWMARYDDHILTVFLCVCTIKCVIHLSLWLVLFSMKVGIPKVEAFCASCVKPFPERETYVYTVEGCRRILPATNHWDVK